MTTSDMSVTEPGPDSLADTARDHLWMHFTRHSVYEDGPATSRSSSAARAPTIWDDQGKRYLDGLAGLFTVQVGHGRTELAEAVAKQAEQLAFFPLWSYAHPTAIELAERLADLRPGDLNRVFFTTGGGEAVETAWKLAKQYFKLTGKPTKHKVISRDVAYHGTPAGRPVASPASPQPRSPSSRWSPALPRCRTPTSTAPREHGDDLEAFGRWAADRIAEAIEFEGPDTVAAVFLEPVQNSGGCFPPPPGYFERVREICDQYDVLLVADETICAFGRIGDMFAMNRYGVQPDIITCAKGMTSGYAPLGAMIVQRPALRAVQARAPTTSCTATPWAVTRCPPPSRWPTSTSSSARTSTTTCGTTRLPSGAPWRSCSTCRSSATSAATGYFYGIELVKDKATKETFNDDEAERLLRGFLSKALFDAGLYCRADDRGDPVIQLAPPLIIGQTEFDEIEADPALGAHRGHEPPLGIPGNHHGRAAAHRGNRSDHALARSRARLLRPGARLARSWRRP